jgi:hypothetical protein
LGATLAKTFIFPLIHCGNINGKDLSRCGMPKFMTSQPKQILDYRLSVVDCLGQGGC